MEFQATNNSAQRKWTQRATRDDFRYGWRDGCGVPVETMVSLCNRLDATAWFCMPENADDEYVRTFASLVKNLLKQDIAVCVEFSNEVGNRAFSAFHEAVEHSRARGFADDADDPDIAAARFYSARSIEIFRIWKSVFAGQEHRIFGVVTAIARKPSAMASVREILNFQNAWREIDAIATAPYIGVGIQNRLPEPIETISVEQLLDFLGAELLGQVSEEIDRMAALAREFGPSSTLSKH